MKNRGRLWIAVVSSVTTPFCDQRLAVSSNVVDLQAEVLRGEGAFARAVLEDMNFQTIRSHA